jgi:hypothetical protein
MANEIETNTTQTTGTKDPVPTQTSQDDDNNGDVPVVPG